MSRNIAEKVVGITGASSGLGVDAARHLGSEGAAVVLGARRVEKLESIMAEIRQSGGKAEALATDVSNAEQVKALVDKAIEAFGRVDVLINNAGIMPIAPLSELKVDEWERMIDINIRGVLYRIAATQRDRSANALYLGCL